MHPKYNKVASYYDVAILETSPITFSKFISPVCLPNLASDDIHKYDHDSVELIGWGQENLNGKTSDRLRRVQLTIYSQR